MVKQLVRRAIQAVSGIAFVVFLFAPPECDARDGIVRHLHPNASGLPLLLVTPVWQRVFRILATRIVTRDLEKIGK